MRTDLFGICYISNNFACNGQRYNSPAKDESNTNCKVAEIALKIVPTFGFPVGFVYSPAELMFNRLSHEMKLISKCWRLMFFYVQCDTCYGFLMLLAALSYNAFSFITYCEFIVNHTSSMAIFVKNI